MVVANSHTTGGLQGPLLSLLMTRKPSVFTENISSRGLFWDNLFKSGAELGPGGGAQGGSVPTVVGSDPRPHLGGELLSPRGQKNGSVQLTDHADGRLKEVVTGTSVTSTAPQESLFHQSMSPIGNMT